MHPYSLRGSTGARFASVNEISALLEPVNEQLRKEVSNGGTKNR